MLAIALIIVALAVVTTLMCCFAIFLQEAFVGGAAESQTHLATAVSDRILDRLPDSAIGPLQPTVALTFSI